LPRFAAFQVPGARAWRLCLISSGYRRSGFRTILICPVSALPGTDTIRSRCGCRVAGMNSFSVWLLAAMFLLSGAVRESPAQSATSVEDVVITKLLQPVYPPLAKQTLLTGNVELTLEIRKDGSIESASVVGGHPLLQQAALDSARRSQFECKTCGEGVHKFQMFYSFQLGPPSKCSSNTSQISKGGEKQEDYPRVTQSQNRYCRRPTRRYLRHDVRALQTEGS
jgi:TonB family protein